MANRFDYFVMFAEMRTGSNLLEENINKFDGLTCYGEAYNPRFIGYLDKAEILGTSLAARNADPLCLIDKMKEETRGLPGFRFFHNHDARISRHCLFDERCAKIILTRNPVDSYLSWRTAVATGRWKETGIKGGNVTKVQFDKAQFEARLYAINSFQNKLLRGLQTTGQTAFYIAYEDIIEIDVLNGMAQFLGLDSRIEHVSQSLKRQNAEPLQERVTNYDEMVQSLAALDYFTVDTPPNFEPRRGPDMPSYVAAATSPIMYLPIKCGPEAQVHQWLAALDGDVRLQHGFDQKTLRQWNRRNATHRSFTVLRHPILRAHAAFCECILDTGPDAYSDIREILRLEYKLPIPKGAVGEGYDKETHRQAFLAFLGFLKKNLRGQTNLRVPPAWASQTQILQGFGQHSLPDMILREDQLGDGLAFLARQLGLEPCALPPASETCPFALSDIYDAEIETAGYGIYRRDYKMLGFRAFGEL